MATPTTITTPDGVAHTFPTRAAARAFQRSHPGARSSEYSQRISRLLAQGATLSQARGHAKPTEPPIRPPRQQPVRVPIGLVFGRFRYEVPLTTGPVTAHGVAERGYVAPKGDAILTAIPPAPIPLFAYVTSLVRLCLADLTFPARIGVVTIDARFVGVIPIGQKRRSPRMQRRFIEEPEEEPEDEDEDLQGEEVERSIFSARMAESSIRAMVHELYQEARTARNAARSQADLVGAFASIVAEYFPFDIDIGSGIYAISMRPTGDAPR